ncbi:MAG: hypothetical protein IPN13_12585 [Bacteroidetes bacterium]|nr:hypothetical protein [Bacteroidota bacterium]
MQSLLLPYQDLYSFDFRFNYRLSELRYYQTTNNSFPVIDLGQDVVVVEVKLLLHIRYIKYLVCLVNPGIII